MFRALQHRPHFATGRTDKPEPVSFDSIFTDTVGLGSLSAPLLPEQIYAVSVRFYGCLIDEASIGEATWRALVFY